VLEHAGRGIEPGDLGATVRGQAQRPAGAAADVEEPRARADAERVEAALYAGSM
jgi:hypothetical protein